MQPTKYMGLGTSDQITLYVEPGKFTEHGMEFFVMNGGWRGRLHNGYVTCLNGKDSWIPQTQTGNIRVLFYGVVPPSCDKDTTSVMLYMDRHINRSKWIRWLPAIASNIEARRSILMFRVTSALRAMRDGWYNPNDYKHVNPSTGRFNFDVDDDIPF